MSENDEAEAWPVGDLHGFLTGSWTLYRTLNDLRLNMPGVLEGDVLVQKPSSGGDADDLVYLEKGELVLGDHRESVHRSFIYKFPDRLKAGHLGEVHFEQGGLFHALDLSSGFQKVSHHDENDTYRGKFRVESNDLWTVNWFITGPSTEIIIDSRYQRKI